MCAHYEMLARHNAIMVKTLGKYISMIDTWICLLEAASSHQMQIDGSTIQVPNELACLVKNLIGGDCCGCDPCRSCEMTGIYTIRFEESAGQSDGQSEPCGRVCGIVPRCDTVEQCDRSFRCKLCRVEMCELAVYRNELCEPICLSPCDIWYDPAVSVEVAMNRYVGFKEFFEQLIELLSNM
jgi:hypothetical protein